MLPKFPKLFKKEWDKVACSFELQEYGVGGGKGWSSQTEPTATPITKADATQFFKPNSHYRVIARALEGPKAGQFIGIVWEHFEPHKGIVALKETKEPKEKEAKQPKDATEVMDQYVTEVNRVLTPIVQLNEILAKVREAFAQPGAPPRSGDEEDGGGESYTIPPPEFDGKLPAIMHPYVVHVIAEEVKSVIDYGVKRIEGAFGQGMPGKAEEKEEEEEPLLPPISKYRTQEPTAPTETLPTAPTEEKTETEEEEEPLLPTLPKEPREETEIPGLGPESPPMTPVEAKQPKLGEKKKTRGKTQ